MVQIIQKRQEHFSHHQIPGYTEVRLTVHMLYTILRYICMYVYMTCMCEASCKCMCYVYTRVTNVYLKVQVHVTCMLYKTRTKLIFHTQITLLTPALTIST
jgi:hypothetical protein